MSNKTGAATAASGAASSKEVVCKQTLNSINGLAWLQPPQPLQPSTFGGCALNPRLGDINFIVQIIDLKRKISIFKPQHQWQTIRRKEVHLSGRFAMQRDRMRAEGSVALKVCGSAGCSGCTPYLYGSHAKVSWLHLWLQWLLPVHQGRQDHPHVFSKKLKQKDK